MNEQKTGRPAFPTNIGEGMTLRDYFAGQALVGMLSNFNMVEAIVELNTSEGDIGKITAKAVYDVADSMLERREFK